MEDEGIHSIGVQEELPTEHNTQEKLLAIRLEIQNEFRQRIVTKFKRRMKRAAHVLRPPQQEIWMYVASTPDEIREWGNKEESMEMIRNEMREREAKTRESESFEEHARDVLVQ
jgi:hypothetical protein